jgi:hypothetical protein
MASRPKIFAALEQAALEQNGAGDHLITGDFSEQKNGGIQ